MIVVDVIRNSKDIVSVSVSGHSGYDDIGKDIVCSSVSTAMEMTINLLEKLNIDFSYKQDETVPMLSFAINRSFGDESKLIQTILENLVYTLENVSKQYNKFLKINEIRR